MNVSLLNRLFFKDRVFTYLLAFTMLCEPTHFPSRCRSSPPLTGNDGEQEKKRAAQCGSYRVLFSHSGSTVAVVYICIVELFVGLKTAKTI